jgi:hypothetical protein
MVDLVDHQLFQMPSRRSAKLECVEADEEVPLPAL